MEKAKRETEGSQFIPWEALAGKTILVTGATGLIGRTLIETLLHRQGEKPIVLALVRDIVRARELFGGDNVPRELRFVEGTVERLPEIAEPVDYIVHGACPTASAYFVEHPVETIAVIVDGTRSMLELAREKRVRGMVHLSSMEVYGQIMTREPLAESALGYIDLASVRSSYSEGKRMAECLCHVYAAEFGVPVKVARLAQTFGAGVARDDGRVFAYMARCALNGENIVLKTDGSKENAYLCTNDAVTAILGLLERGAAGETYNVANEETYCSVKEMAELVAQTLGGGKIEVKTGNGSGGNLYRPAGCLNMSAEKLRMLGWSPTIGLEEMYWRMVEGFRNNSAKSIMESMKKWGE